MKFQKFPKMTPPDVKANKNNKKWNILWLYLTNFYKKYLQNLKYNAKKACIFHLILVCVLSILILSIKNRGLEGFGLTDKICQAWQKWFVDSP